MANAAISTSKVGAAATVAAAVRCVRPRTRICVQSYALQTKITAASSTARFQGPATTFQIIRRLVSLAKTALLALLQCLRHRHLHRARHLLHHSHPLRPTPPRNLHSHQSRQAHPLIHPYPQPYPMAAVRGVRPGPPYPTLLFASMAPCAASYNQPTVAPAAEEWPAAR